MLGVTSRSPTPGSPAAAAAASAQGATTLTLPSALASEREKAPEGRSAAAVQVTCAAVEAVMVQGLQAPHAQRQRS
jgi:hypothetical protein